MCLLFATSNLLFSQTISNGLLSKNKNKSKTAEELSAAERISLTEKGYPVPTVQALEQSIDPEKYIVDAGDVFSINVWGEQGLEIPTQVTPEGKLVVQTIGTLEVAGKTLAQVKQEILEAGKKKYKLRKVTANLMQLLAFRVHVLGEVENPGTFVAQAVDRVSVHDRSRQWPVGLGG